MEALGSLGAVAKSQEAAISPMEAGAMAAAATNGKIPGRRCKIIYRGDPPPRDRPLRGRHNNIPDEGRCNGSGGDPRP
jgi:hypothetical protein